MRIWKLNVGAWKVKKSGVTSHREYWNKDDDDNGDGTWRCCPLPYILAYGFLTSLDFWLFTWLSSLGDHIFSHLLTWKLSKASEHYFISLASGRQKTFVKWIKNIWYLWNRLEHLLCEEFEAQRGKGLARRHSPGGWSQGRVRIRVFFHRTAYCKWNHQPQ